MDIIEHIKSRGMTVAWVARQAGVSRVAVYALRDSTRNPAVCTVVNVAKALGIPPSDIWPDLKGGLE